MLSRFRIENEFATDERCFIVETHNRPEDDGCSIVRARVAPGVTTERHALAATIERYVILDGEGRVEIGSAPAMVVRPLDVVTIPADTAQRITNTGTSDLTFLCVCTPRFRPESYRVVD